ncbi:uncharacterized protein FFC1_05012 [Fusarium fujikuroi]|nr:uncharacterized protein FFC1_05012 [Fusarium fujikuroi]
MPVIQRPVASLTVEIVVAYGEQLLIKFSASQVLQVQYVMHFTHKSDTVSKHQCWGPEALVGCR